MRCTALLLVVTGCFYVQPINQRPSADIIQGTSSSVYRNQQHVKLDSSVYDPEGQTVSVHWRVYACSDATQVSGCDADPYYDTHNPSTDFDVVANRIDGTPTQALRVILEAIDARGAVAKPSQELLLPVVDAPPTVTLDTSSPYFILDHYVDGYPIDVYAKADDADDGAAAVLPSIQDVTAWNVYTPAGASYTLGAPTTTQTTVHRVLTPQGEGNYDIQVTATDPVGSPTTAVKTITVAKDHPPCLAQWSPLAGGTFPMQDPTLFQILVVQDDLDPYPAVAGDPVRGTTAFSWSLLPPGATQRQPLAGVVGNSVALDPASYTPGDVLELRVEIQDRQHTAVNCPDGDATCSVISDPSCIQRLTWRVEVQ
ncbi:MAG: hypothetical protein ACM31C_18865 [Acidobacteriota bacterium]